MGNTESSIDERVIDTSERREQIIQQSQQQGGAQINDLSLFFGVSTVTIRGGLAFLKKQGTAVRAYDGALICENSAPVVKPSVEDKSSLNMAAKHSIARAAAELVQPGHRVILDSGTTICEIARLMCQHTSVIAMTNSVNVTNTLLEAEGVELLVTDGRLRRQSQSFYGDQAEQSLQNYHFDMLFFSVDIIDLECNVSTHNEGRAHLNHRMCEAAERIIVVTNSTKFNRSGLRKIIDTQRIHTIIIDGGIPEEGLQELHRSGVKVIIVEQSRSKIQRCGPIQLDKNKP